MLKTIEEFGAINIFYNSQKFDITEDEAVEFLSKNGNIGTVKVKKNKSNDCSDSVNFQLQFIEVIYLCLKHSENVHVYDKLYNELDMKFLWNEALDCVGEKFPLLYIAYNYYRSKGWIVKNGHIFGVDFLLYEKDINQCHAKYSVLVRFAKNEDDIRISNQELFMKIRLTHSVNKILKYCWIIADDSKKFEDHSTINTHTIKELTMNRFDI